MDKSTFDQYLAEQAAVIGQIKERAHKVHADVNQHYDGDLPYSVHLDSVVHYVKEYAHEIVDDYGDIVPLMFGAYFHDSIEDARLTYNNVLSIAKEIMDEERAVMATEIAYALTNEKGRTRAERADERYYRGIRSTAYAPLCKVADRLANATYSASHARSHKPSMKEVYARENAHFLDAIVGQCTCSDKRMHVPEAMVSALVDILK